MTDLNKTKGNSIIIGHASMAGGTLLAKKISALTGLPIRYGAKEIEAWSTAFPELQINSQDRNSTSVRFAPFIRDYLAISDDKLSRPEIVDCYHLTPQQVADFGLKKYNVVFVGYPDVDADTKAEQVAKYEPVYRPNASHEELKKLVEAQIELSKEIQEDCRKLGLTFIDTSYNFDQAIDKAANDLFTAVKFPSSKIVPQ
jgi:hypothetical protein